MLPLDDKDLIEIPIDEIQLGHDADGLPRVEATDTPATGKPIEAEAEPAHKPTVRKAPEAPQVTEADLNAERQRSQRLQAERDRLAQEREAEHRRAETNETYALNAHRRSVHADYDKAEGDHQQIVAGISSTKATLDAIKRDLKAANTESDWDRVSELTEHMGLATAQLLALESGRGGAAARVAETKRIAEDTERALEGIREKRKEVPAAEAKPQQPVYDKPEDWVAAQTDIPPAIKTWLTDHVDFVTDQKKWRKVNNFATEWADDNGRESIGGSKFIEAMNERFFPETQEQEAEVAETEVVEPKAAEPQRRSQPAAPVSRTSAPGKAGGGSIKLTQAEYAIAPEVINAFEDLDPDLQAKYKVWSPTAARVQYDRNNKRADKDGKRLRA